MDINISANTLFHFTANRQNLLGILANGLYARYSLENYETIINDTAELVFPMACFCDIPLSQIKRHTSIYGQYAIGFTKDWGMRKKINPVIYTYPKSTTATILNDLLLDIEKFFDIKEGELPKSSKARMVRRDQTTSKTTIALRESFIDYQLEANSKVTELSTKLAHFIKYIKPYQGKFFRDGHYLEKEIRFYEEREWRFVPDRKVIHAAKLKDSFKAEYYKDRVTRRAINMKLAKHAKLTFSPNDIRFIIVSRDNEIPDMLNELHRIFGKNTAYDDLKLLGTRLISLQQIIEDL